MGQLAVKSESGQLIEAFSVDEDEWRELCAAPRGALLMPRSDWPAVPKTSIRGLRFFAHLPGYTGVLPKSESYAHTRLKIDIVKAARALGFQADIEVAGSTPEGEHWIADTVVTHKDGNRTAFEVQLSSQHLKDFRLRTERYGRSSIDCIWVVAEHPVASRLAKAIARENNEHFKKHGLYQSDDRDLIVFGAQIPNKDNYPAECPLLRFGRGKEVRFLSLHDAVQGALNSAPLWLHQKWSWQDKQSTDS